MEEKIDKYLEKNERNKRIGWLSYFDYLLIILLMILIVVVVTGIFIIKQQGSSCMANPLVYGVKELSRQNDVDVSCTCRNPKSKEMLYVTSNGSTIQKLYFFTKENITMKGG